MADLPAILTLREIVRIAHLGVPKGKDRGEKVRNARRRFLGFLRKRGIDVSNYTPIALTTLEEAWPDLVVSLRRKLAEHHTA